MGVAGRRVAASGHVMSVRGAAARTSTSTTSAHASHWRRNHLLVALRAQRGFAHKQCEIERRPNQKSLLPLSHPPAPFGAANQNLVCVCARARNLNGGRLAAAGKAKGGAQEAAICGGPKPWEPKETLARPARSLAADGRPLPVAARCCSLPVARCPTKRMDAALLSAACANGPHHCAIEPSFIMAHLCALALAHVARLLCCCALCLALAIGLLFFCQSAQNATMARTRLGTERAPKRNWTQLAPQAGARRATCCWLVLAPAAYKLAKSRPTFWPHNRPTGRLLSATARL